jgi:hypothetical protein
MQVQQQCPTHDLPYKVYCSSCQKLLCGMCVADHGAPPHSLVYILDYARLILKAQLAERLAAVKARTTALPIPQVEEVGVWIASLESFLAETTKELDKLKLAYYRLQDYSRSLKNPEYHTDLVTRMQQLAADIEKFGKDTAPPAVISASMRFEKLSELMSLLEGGKLQSVYPGASIQALTQQRIPEALRAATASVSHFVGCLEPHYSCVAKFVNERYDMSYAFLWTLSNDDHTAEKTGDTNTITICGVDTEMKDGQFEIMYKIDAYVAEDSCDSIGIGPKASFSTDAFNSGNMYGLVNGRITGNNVNTNVDYRFKSGDMIKIIYSSIAHTLEFWANNVKLGATITGVLANTYHTGIAFRKTGNKVSLFSFHQI